MSEVLSLLSSLRTQGPITTGTHYDRRSLPPRQPERTRSMGPPRFRGGDGLKHQVHPAHPHDLNNRVYCVSCRRLARSARKVELPRSSSEASSARLPVETTTGSSNASMRWLSVCPSGISRA